EFGSSMERLERGKKLLCVGRIEPHAVVAHEKRGTAILSADAKLDSAARPPGRRLPRVAEQILEHDAEQTWITVSGRVRVNDEFYVPHRIVLAQVARHGASDCTQIHRLAMQFDASDARERQHGINELVHPRDRGANPA